MTICGVAFVSMMSYAQRIDSTYNQTESTGIHEMDTLNQNLNQSTAPQSIQGVQQDTTSPVIQPLPQSQQPLQSQPELQLQPLQTQPQVPTQALPVPTNPAQQNQPVQPAPAPTPTDPAGTSPPK